MQDHTQKQLDCYIGIYREKLINALENKDFIGKIGCEVNCKNGGIVNMNIIPPREFVKI